MKKKNTLSRYALATTILMGILSPLAILNGANGEWYYSGNATTDSVVRTDTSIGVTNNSSRSNFGIIYFDKVSLAAGESLTVSFSAVLDVNPALFIARAGLYDSNGSRISADNQSSSNSIYSDYRGYTMGIGSNAEGNVSPLRLYARDLASNSLITTGGATNLASEVSRPATASANNVFLSARSYDFAYVISRNDNDTISVSLSIAGEGLNNYSASWDSLAGGYAFYDFDSFAFGMGNNVDWRSFLISDFNLSFVPEPSTYAIFFGITAAIVAVRRCRKRVVS